MLLSGRRRHRSRDKDGRYTIGSAMAETPCCTQTSRLSFLRPKLLPIKVFHCVYREFRLFIAKMAENIKYLIRTAKLIKMIPKHIFWPIIDCFSM